MKCPAIVILVASILLIAPDHAVSMGRPTKWEQMQQIARKLDVPIVFYGIVTDDGGVPVSNAQVEVHYAHFAVNYGGGVSPKEETTIKGHRGHVFTYNK